jgi:lauroyl/myristoyl acyltransferase
MKSLLAVLDKLRFFSTLEILRLLPLSSAIRWIQLSGRTMHSLCPRQRRQAIQWLRNTVPAGTPSLDISRMASELFVYASLHRYLSYLLLLHDANNCRDLLEVQGWGRVEQALAQNKGVVLLSTHLGLPRLERWFLRTQPYRVYFLYRIGFAGQRDQSWRARLQRWHRNRYRLDSDPLLGNEAFSLQYMKKAHDHLRQNGIISISGDGSAGGRRYPVTICGRQHSFAAGGISLGLLTGAAVLPSFTSVHTSARFLIEIQEPLVVPNVSPSPADRNAVTRAMVEAYAARVDEYILRHPTNVALPRYSLRIPV